MFRVKYGHSKRDMIVGAKVEVRATSHTDGGERTTSTAWNPCAGLTGGRGRGGDAGLSGNTPLRRAESERYASNTRNNAPKVWGKAQRYLSRCLGEVREGKQELLLLRLASVFAIRPTATFA